MPLFYYRGRNARGALVTGQLELENESAVVNQLSGNSITPIEITATAPKQSLFANANARMKQRKVKLTDRLFFSRQMYTLMRAGIPILEALQSLRESTPSDTFAGIIGALRESLNAGESLAIALRHHPDVFSDLYVGIIEIGEASGTLAESFLQLAGYLEKEAETASRISAAMRYPMIVISFIAAAMVIINLFVIPAFAKLFAQFHAELPLPTRIVLAISNTMLTYWYVLLLAGAIGATLIRGYLKTPAGQLQWHRYKLRLPIVGGIIFRATLARFAHALGICVRAGVPWGKGMELVGNAVDNLYVQNKVMAMREGVERGDTITRTLSASALFPPLVLQMVRVGEQTGALDDMLREVADYYVREVDYQLKYLSTIIEPVLLVIVGAMVLILALAVFLPMWGLASAAFHK